MTRVDFQPFDEVVRAVMLLACVLFRWRRSRPAFSRYPTNECLRAHDSVQPLVASNNWFSQAVLNCLAGA